MCIKSRENKNITLCTDVLLKKKRKKKKRAELMEFSILNHICA